MSDNPFILPITKDKYVKPAAPDRTSEKRIFNKYKKGTVEKLETSLSELKGRYGDDLSGTGETQAYEKARPSINWRVNKDFVEMPLSEQKVDVFLKVGIAKQIIDQDTAPDGTPIPLKEITLTPAQAGEWFNGMIEQISGAEKGTAAGEAFHKMAIEAAVPPGIAWIEGPDKEQVEGVWEHNEDTDLYEAVAKAEQDAEEA